MKILKGNIWKKSLHNKSRKEFYHSGGWIRTIGLRVMSPSGSPDYPTSLQGFICQVTWPGITTTTYERSHIYFSVDSLIFRNLSRNMCVSLKNSRYFSNSSESLFSPYFFMFSGFSGNVFEIPNPKSYVCQGACSAELIVKWSVEFTAKVIREVRRKKKVALKISNRLWNPSKVSAREKSSIWS